MPADQLDSLEGMTTAEIRVAYESGKLDTFLGRTPEPEPEPEPEPSGDPILDSLLAKLRRPTGLESELRRKLRMPPADTEEEPE